MTLITFEGGEGSGKSTAIKTVAQVMRALGHTVFDYAEPGSSPLGQVIREALLKPQYKGKGDGIDKVAQLLLFGAARAQFVSTILKPTMARNPSAVFLIDRFTDSTIAYQHYGYGLDFHRLVAPVVNMAAKGVIPNMTLFFDVYPSIALMRKEECEKNHIDRENIDFHERIYHTYNAMCNAEPERWHRVDATQTKEAVAAAVLELISEKIIGASLW